MLVSAAVCPHPPLLVPEIGPATEGVLDDLRAACASAIDAIRASEPEQLVVVGGGEATDVHRPGTRGSFQPYGVDVSVVLPGPRERDDGPRLPLSIAVGAWLLEQAGWQGEVHAQEVAVSAPAEVCRQLGVALAQQADRIALLVMGDGSARRSVNAPGGLDPRAEAFDVAVVEALRAGDPAALLALDGALAAELQVAGRAPWQVLAGAAGEAALDADVLFDGAPYGVGYMVAVWERHG